MQRTRLSTLTDVAITRLENTFSNPWRRMSLILIGFLMGIFIGEAVATTAGQGAYWDVVAAGLLLLFTEAASVLIYSRQRRQSNRRNLWLEVLNAFKMGVAYSLYLEAFKLGS
jgi:hypothetical protein